MFDSIPRMPSWSDFAAAAPRLAIEIHNIIHQYGQGFAYLATVRPDGGPRVHPVAPVIAEGGLFCFLIASPKRNDLERDGRYALHSYPGDHNDDEAYLTGHAHPVTDPRRRERVARAARADTRGDWRLFELDIDVATITRHVGVRRTPTHQIWHATGQSPGGGRTRGRTEAIAVCA